MGQINKGANLLDPREIALDIANEMAPILFGCIIEYIMYTATSYFSSSSITKTSTAKIEELDDDGNPKKKERNEAESKDDKKDKKNSELESEKLKRLGAKTRLLRKNMQEIAKQNTKIKGYFLDPDGLTSTISYCADNKIPIKKELEQFGITPFVMALYLGVDKGLGLESSETEFNKVTSCKYDSQYKLISSPYGNNLLHELIYQNKWDALVQILDFTKLDKQGAIGKEALEYTENKGENALDSLINFGSLCPDKTFDQVLNLYKELEVQPNFSTPLTLLMTLGLPKSRFDKIWGFLSDENKEKITEFVSNLDKSEKEFSKELQKSFTSALESIQVPPKLSYSRKKIDSGTVAVDKSYHDSFILLEKDNPDSIANKILGLNFFLENGLDIIVTSHLTYIAKYLILPDETMPKLKNFIDAVKDKRENIQFFKEGYSGIYPGVNSVATINKFCKPTLSESLLHRISYEGEINKDDLKRFTDKVCEGLFGKNVPIFKQLTKHAKTNAKTVLEDKEKNPSASTKPTSTKQFASTEITQATTSNVR